MTHLPLPARPRCAYGVDLVGGVPRVVRSSRTRKGFRHEVVHGGPAAEREGAFAQVRAELRRDGDGGRAVVAAGLPVEASFTRWLRTPFAAVAKARKVFPSLLDIQLPFPLEQCRYHFLSVARTPERQVETLAVAARKEDVTRRLHQLGEWEFDPDWLDHEGLALWTQSIRELPGAADSFRVVAYLGHDRSALVLGQSGRFHSAHGTRVGARDVHGGGDQPVAPSPGSAAERFGHRARQLLRAHLPGAQTSPIEWAWTGPGAEDAACLASLQEAVAQPNIRFHTHDEPALFLARALACRALQEGPLLCNFRTGDLTHPRAARQTARQRRATAVGALCAGLLLCGLNVAWRAAVQLKKERAQQQLTSVALNLAPDTRIPYGQEVLSVARALDERAPLTEPFLEAFRPSLTLLLSEILETAARQQLALHTLSLRGTLVSLGGTSEDYNRCEALEQKLAAHGFEVALQRRDAGADELVHFSLQGIRSP